MTTMKDLVADTRRTVYGSMADQLNFLSAEAPMGAAELFMTMELGAIQPGMVLSSDLNVYYVIGVEPIPKRVLVYPNYDNSPNDPLPVGSPVMIRPRVTDWHLFTVLCDVIRQMSSRTNGLYQTGSWTSTQNMTWQSYPIPPEAQDLTGINRVYSREYGAGWDRWVEVNPVSVKWQPGLKEVRLTNYEGWNREVRFEYRKPFTIPQTLTDDLVTDVGLSDTMVDIPPLGAAVSLLRTTESRRQNIHNQGDTRRAGEVAGGGNSSAARELERDFKGRIDDEYIRLTNSNPWTKAI